MDQITGNKIIQLQKAALDDEFYKELLAEYETISQRFVRAMDEMSPEHRTALEDYFGITGAMHLRLLEMAIEL